jgi:hypothetical protein
VYPRRSQLSVSEGGAKASGDKRAVLSCVAVAEPSETPSSTSSSATPAGKAGDAADRRRVASQVQRVTAVVNSIAAVFDFLGAKVFGGARVHFGRCVSCAATCRTNGLACVWVRECGAG